MYDTSKYEHFKFVCFAGRGPFRVTLTKKVSEMLTFFSVFNQFCVYIREKWHSQKNVHKVLGAFLLLLTYQLRRSVPKQKKRFIVIFQIKKYIEVVIFVAVESQLLMGDSYITSAPGEYILIN